MPITVRQLTPVFGAEITNVDLTRALDDATFAEIENAFETYSVLVFPRQNLNDDSQIAFSSRFGALETTQGHIANNFTIKQVSVISNLDPNGRLMAADDPRLIYRIGQRNWHSDSSFKRVPAKASLLHARLEELGYDATGGTAGEVREDSNIIRAEISKWEGMIRNAGMRME